MNLGEWITENIFRSSIGSVKYFVGPWSNCYSSILFDRPNSAVTKWTNSPLKTVCEVPAAIEKWKKSGLQINAHQNKCERVGSNGNVFINVVLMSFRFCPKNECCWSEAAAALVIVANFKVCWKFELYSHRISISLSSLCWEPKCGEHLANFHNKTPWPAILNCRNG